jgi:hypothetical protein
MRVDVHLRGVLGGIPPGFLWAAAVWPLALVTVLFWRTGRLGAWAPLSAAAVELAVLFYLATTEWGWAVDLQARSRILNELSRQRPQGLTGGEIENLPVRAGLATAHPYLGFAHLSLNSLLALVQDQLDQGGLRQRGAGLNGIAIKRWLRRCRVSHLVGTHRALLSWGRNLGNWRDPALDRVVRREPGDPAARSWSIVELAEPFPEARVTSQARTVIGMGELVDRLTREDDVDLAWFLAEDRVPDRARARSARLVSWDGTNAIVEHDGPCDLVVARSFDPGWMATINGGHQAHVLRVDGGYLAVRLTGSGVEKIALRYRPQAWQWWLLISSVSAAAVIGILILEMARRISQRRVALLVREPIKD